MSAQTLETYGPEYAHLHEVAKRAAHGWAEREEMIAVYENLLPLGLRPGDVMLDVGGGLGLTGHILQTYGINTVNVDVNPHATAKAYELWGEQPGNAYVQADVTQPLNFPDKSFDFVRSQDLLEHLPTVETAHQVFNEMARLNRSSRMLHLITVLEETENIHADPTHHIKRPAAWWKDFFATHGWETVHPTTIELPVDPTDPAGPWTFHRHGFFLLEKADAGEGAVRQPVVARTVEEALRKGYAFSDEALGFAAVEAALYEARRLRFMLPDDKQEGAGSRRALYLKPESLLDKMVLKGRGIPTIYHMARELGAVTRQVGERNDIGSLASWEPNKAVVNRMVPHETGVAQIEGHIDPPRFKGLVYVLSGARAEAKIGDEQQSSHSVKRGTLEVFLADDVAREVGVKQPWHQVTANGERYSIVFGHDTEGSLSMGAIAKKLLRVRPSA